MIKKKEYEEIKFNIEQMKSEIRYCRNAIDVLNENYMKDETYIEFVRENINELIYMLRNNKIKTMQKVLERLNRLL